MYKLFLVLQTVKIQLVEFCELMFMRIVRLPRSVSCKPMSFNSMNNLKAIEII